MACWESRCPWQRTAIGVTFYHFENLIRRSRSRCRWHWIIIVKRQSVPAQRAGLGGHRRRTIKTLTPLTRSNHTQFLQVTTRVGEVLKIQKEQCAASVECKSKSSRRFADPRRYRIELEDRSLRACQRKVCCIHPYFKITYVTHAIISKSARSRHWIVRNTYAFKHRIHVQIFKVPWIVEGSFDW